MRLLAVVRCLLGLGLVWLLLVCDLGLVDRLREFVVALGVAGL